MATEFRRLAQTPTIKQMVLNLVNVTVIRCCFVHIPTRSGNPIQSPIERLAKVKKKRMEVMMELNKWTNNDSFMAKRAAETLVLLLADQFDINLVQLEK